MVAWRWGCLAGWPEREHTEWASKMAEVVWVSPPPLLDDAAPLLDHFIKIAHAEVKTSQTDDQCLSPSVLEV
uniref:Uncharacterized protein n=1 Tax=Triticum urartu TaxID=4572 RepID=A0A8R7NZE0_TRIUA